MKIHCAKVIFSLFLRRGGVQINKNIFFSLPLRSRDPIR